MKDDKPFDISQVRKDIDRVDTALLELIAERLDLARYVKKAKRGGPIWRPSREESHVRDLVNMTQGHSAALVSRIWAELMSASLSIQGPLMIHVGLHRDQNGQTRALIHDRFGASLPIEYHANDMAALAAAYGDENSVAIVSAPGKANRWWAALCPGGAMPDHKIMARLPRYDASDWPDAVAVAIGELAPSGHDISLLATQTPKALPKGCVLRAESGANILASLDGFHTQDTLDPSVNIIGVLPHPLS